MFQKVTKALLYAGLQQVRMEMRASKPACAVVLSTRTRVRAGAKGPISVTKLAFGSLGLSEITMKSVKHRRPSLRTVHLLPSRPSYPEACGLLRHVCTHTPIEKNSLEPRLLWILSHSSPLMSYVSLDKYINLSKVSFPFLQNKNSTASLADTIWITD